MVARILFFGSGEFAVPSLRALTGSQHALLAVVTQPDRPKGRGQKLQPVAVAQVAREQGIALLQPPKARAAEFVEQVRALAPDLLLVAAYGQILPAELLAAGRRGAINLHASLLPRYRGAAPIQYALLGGEATTGVTTMLMEARLDAGPILLQEEAGIGRDEDAIELTQRLADLGAQLLLRTITLWLAERLEARRQDEALATYAPKLTSQLSPIDWSRPALQLHNQVRALVPWPVACTWFGGQRIRIWRSRPADGSGSAGTVLAVERDQLRVACGDGALDLLEIQLEGRRRLAAGDAARGLQLGRGMRFENPVR